MKTDNAETSFNWREEYAYTLGVQAYICWFPWIYLPTLRWKWVTQPVNPDAIPYAPLNHFWHNKTLADARYRDGGSPNQDTLYSVAWVDLSQDPVILSVPDTEGRYYTMELASMDSDNFAYVGKRMTGTKAGHYAIAGPGWQGALPDDVQMLEPSRTPSVLIVGRTLIDGPEDAPNVHKLQEQYKLTPLGLWGKSDAKAPESRDVWEPFDAENDPLAEWKTMNRAMTEEPPEERHIQLLKLFAAIGVGPGQDVELMEDSTKRGLARAAIEGRKLLASVITTGTGKIVNGWRYTPPTLGRAGVHNDFFTRAWLQCLAGIVANDPDEAVYLTGQVDDKGRNLTGESRYVIRFAPDQIPKVEGFWSITMYGMDYCFVDNPIDRYAVGDRTPGLQYDAEGGLTIYIQADSPGSDKESNWLPAPKGQFWMAVRAYLPAREIIEQIWQPPALQKVK